MSPSQEPLLLACLLPLAKREYVYNPDTNAIVMRYTGIFTNSKVPSFLFPTPYSLLPTP
ncbi:MAG: hypothetical protein F6J90_30275 [Moorea sp. SIOASIH]|nr:hypothetical protein [Moorena sp. SIOASIH]